MSEQPPAIVARLSSLTRGRPCTQQVILEEIRRVILAGAAPSGTPIPLEAVARFFAVSPIPVRESLKTLLGEGLVTPGLRTSAVGEFAPPGPKAYDGPLAGFGVEAGDTGYGQPG